MGHQAEALETIASFYYPVNPAGCHPFINEGEVGRVSLLPLH